MPTNQVNEVLQHLRQAVLRYEGAGLTDGQLLGCFIEHRDEAAFATLVRRHGPMVWGVCRRLLPNHHDAEDAFQATFLVLVRKAASVVPREMVGNWLYGVAHQTARKARATTAKRHTRERQVTAMPEPAPESDLWADLQPLLDQELSRLPDKYRAIIVLCDLEGKTRREAARQLGCPEGTVASRLAAGRAMLAKRLARYGPTVSGVTLAAVLTQNVASASVPAAVISSTIGATSLLAAGQAAAGLISVNAAALAEGVLKTMLLNKLKIASVLLVLGFFGIGGVGWTYRTQAAGQTDAAQPDQHRQGDVQQGKRKSAQDVEALIEKAKREVAVAEAQLQKAEAMLQNAKEHYRRLQALHEALQNQKDKGDTPKKDTAKSDKERIQGTWRLVKAEINGVEFPFAFLQPKEGALARFTGEKWTCNIFMEGKPFTFKLDPTSKPKAIDLHPLENPGKTLLGIYRLEGDDLTICFCQNGKQERPSAFANYWRAGSYTELFVLKRQADKVVKPPKDQEEVRQLLEELLKDEKVRQLFAERRKEADLEKKMGQFLGEIRRNPALLEDLLKDPDQEGSEGASAAH